MTNVARGYAQMGEPDKAMAMLERAKKIQANAPSVRSLEVILLSRNGNEPKALAIAREDINAGAEPFDELWHLVKPLDNSGEWAIAGITPLNG